MYDPVWPDVGIKSSQISTKRPYVTNRLAFPKEISPYVGYTKESFYKVESNQT